LFITTCIEKQCIRPLSCNEVKMPSILLKNHNGLSWRNDQIFNFKFSIFNDQIFNWAV